VLGLDSKDSSLAMDSDFNREVSSGSRGSMVEAMAFDAFESRWIEARDHLKNRFLGR
jgi:hypothetical protein